MATNVIMPALGITQDTGQVVRWLNREGDHVSKGEAILEIETDKVTTEVEAPEAGILARITAEEGSVVPVGETIAVILADGEALPPEAEQGAAQAETPVETAQPAAAQAETPVETAQPAAAQGPNVTPRLVPASPRARRQAAARGLDLSTLAAGSQGPVHAQDIANIPEVNLPAVTAPWATQPEADDSAVPVPAEWRLMAERVTASWTTAPHFYLMREVMVTQLVSLRKALVAAAEAAGGAKPTYTDLLVKIVAVALQSHPLLNARVVDGARQLNDGIRIGLATATKRGLVVPVIRDADRMSIAEVAAARSDLVTRALTGKLQLSDLTDGTFTVSNLGMYRVDGFLPIVNPPQAALLAVGRIQDRVVAVDGRPEVRACMTLTLACDHRAVDGARGAAFLDKVATLMEEPNLLLY